MSREVMFLCSRLDCPGGIERAIVNTANLLQSKGRRVCIAILDETMTSFYDLHAEIKVVQLPLHFGITSKGNFITRKISFFLHVRELAKLFSEIKPQVVIGTEYYLSIAAYLASRRKLIRVYAWEHHHFHWLQKSRFWRNLQHKIFPRLDSVICLNSEEERLFATHGCRTVVIPNFIERQKKNDLNTKKMLSIGWLIKRKGFDLVPAIARHVFAQYPDWSWTIIGSGELETEIRAELRRYGLEKNVLIQAPVSAELNQLYADASVYVMTSRFECFPMVLLEAMSHGIPVVSFDCSTGPSFIVQHQKDGILVEAENVKAMAEAVLSLIENDERRKRFGDSAYEDILRFSSDAVYVQWQRLLQ